MPYRRRYTNKRKPRIFKKKRFQKYRKQWKQFGSRITRSIQPPFMLADKTFTKLKFTGMDNLVFAANQFVAIPIEGNGFDNTGVTTLYPPGLLTWGQFYTRYRVFGSKIKVTFINNDAAATPTVGLYCREGDDAVAIDNTNVLDQPYSRWRMLARAGGMDKVILKSFMKSKKLFGNKVSQEEDYQGLFLYSPGTNDIIAVANPVSSWDWAIFATSNTPLATTNISITYEVSYYVQFEDRRTQTTQLPVVPPSLVNEWTHKVPPVISITEGKELEKLSIK